MLEKKLKAETEKAQLQLVEEEEWLKIELYELELIVKRKHAEKDEVNGKQRADCNCQMFTSYSVTEVG